MEVKQISRLENVNKALNWIDGKICEIINSGDIASFVIGKKSEIDKLMEAWQRFIEGGFEDRSIPQNDKIHAIFADIRQTGVIRMPGKRIVMSDYDEEAVKAFCVVWFAKEMAENGTPLPKPPRTVIDPISGDLVTIRPSTKDFGKKIMSEFIEWLYATGSQAGVIWSDPVLAFYDEARK